MSKPHTDPSCRLTCADARFVEVEFPLQLRPRLVIEFSEGLRLLLEDDAAVPLAAEFIGKRSTDPLSHFCHRSGISDKNAVAGLPTLLPWLRSQASLILFACPFIWSLYLVGCRRLMAESPEGVAIQIYSALMLQLLIGKRPNKRAMELIRFYLMGHADLDEVMALLRVEKTAV